MLTKILCTSVRFSIALLSLSICHAEEPCSEALNPLRSIESTSADITAGVETYWLKSKEFLGISGQPRPEEQVIKVPLKFASNELSVNELKALASPHYEASNDAGLILMFRAPTSFSLRDCGENAVSISEADGNSMINPNALVSKFGVRTSNVDAIGRTRELKSESGDCQHSLTFGIKTFQLLNPGNGAGYDLIALPVSSKTIEAFHSTVGYNDPYNRLYYGLDHFSAKLTDPNGKTFDGKQGQLFVMPLTISYKQYQEIFANDSDKITLVKGAQGSVPVDQAFGQASLGVDGTLVTTHKINDNWAATLGAGVGLNLQKTMYGGYQPSDNKSGVDPGYNAHIAGALTHVTPEEHSTSFVVDIDTQSPLLRSRPYAGSLVTEQQSFVVAQGQHANVGNENGVSISIVTRTPAHAIQIGCREDFIGKGWKDNGNNNEDFKCSAQYTHFAH